MARNRSAQYRFWRIVLIAALVYVALCAFLYVYQPRLLYLPGVPTRDHVATPKALGLDYTPVRIGTADGEALDGWFVPAAKARGTLLFFHGNAGNISHRLRSIADFHALGLAVLIVDYRGYGASTGEPTEDGTYADATAAWRYLTETRGVAADRIVLFGRSLGGAVAANLASRVRPAGLILESAFTSAPDLAAEYYWFVPARWLTRFRYDNRAALAAIDCPVLVIHSRQDEIVPFAHGRALFETARAPKDFLELRGGHNDGFVVSGRTYTDGLDAFLEKALGKERAPSAR